jgi:hypothetical protein
MTTHATLPDTATVSARIAQLPLLPMDSIWAMWDEHFDQRPNHHHRTAVGKVLDHIGESTQPPRIAPARGPPLWEAAAAAEQAGNDLQWDSSAQPAPEIEFDQRIAW